MAYLEQYITNHKYLRTEKLIPLCGPSKRIYPGLDTWLSNLLENSTPDTKPFSLTLKTPIPVGILIANPTAEGNILVDFIMIDEHYVCRGMINEFLDSLEWLLNDRVIIFRLPNKIDLLYCKVLGERGYKLDLYHEKSSMQGKVDPVYIRELKAAEHGVD